MKQELTLDDFMNGKTDGQSFKVDILGKPDSAGHDINISLITPNVIGSVGQIRRVQPPLGIACIAAVLDEYNFKNIQIIDSSAEGYNNVVDLGDGFIKFGLDNKVVVDKVIKFNPKIIGLSALFSSQIGCAFELAKEIKNALPDCIIFFGGIHATKNSHQLLKEEDYIDFIIEGEADYTCTLFCKMIEKGEDVRSIPGLVWRDPIDKVKTHSNPQLPGLDMNELPFPAWHLINMEMYYDIGMPHNPFMKSREFLTVMTERGCPEKCYFCSSADFFGDSGRFRPLTPENAYQMIKYGVDNFNVKELQIEDDTFTLNSKRVVEFCKKIRPLNLRITLPNSIRADAPKNHERRLEMFEYMVEAGFAKIGISAEHGDQDFLDKVVGKRLNLDEIVASIDLAHKAGLMVHTNFMMGFPFETKENRQKTIDFSKSLLSDSFSVSLAAPLPGTKMWDICEEHNLFMDDFDVNRIVYDVVNIKPHDISPKELKDLVISLNTELNSAAKARSNEARDYYNLFKGKSSSGDRKYAHDDKFLKIWSLKYDDSHGSVVPKK
jgi:anaerobic magnesium-protoporphyrin IX monomethyl ester cyclase